MNERNPSHEDEGVDRALLAVKDAWEIEPPQALVDQVMQQLSTRTERELFGLVAWSLSAAFVISALLTSAAAVYMRRSRDWMLALLWEGVGL